MLRFSPRFGWMTMALGAFVAACGSSDDVPAASGTGGFPFGGFIGAGGAFGADGGATAIGGAGGVPAGGAGGGFGAGGFGTGGFGAGGFGVGGTFGAGGSSSGGSSSGGAMTDGGVPDGSTPDGSTSDASSGTGGASTGGSTSTGGTSSSGGASAAGGASSADAGAAYCGNHVIDGTDKCDDGAVDTATCDSDCTKPKCGDGHLNTAAGEFCDDGGNKAGDGCDALCQLENTCPTPQPIALTASAPGTVHGTVADDTTDATSHVNPADCDGAPAGSGPDTLYSFTVDRTRNVTLSLTAGFNAILRTYTKACVPGAGLSESGGDACSNVGVGNETMSFSRLAAGTYFVVVDGAGANDKGAYTLDVTGTCDGIDQLRLVELGIGTTDYAVIRNMSDCPTFLGGATVSFEDSKQGTVTTALPAITLAPGEQLRIQDNLGAAVPGAIDSGGNIPFQYDRGGTVLLCKSNCATAADVVDALQFADGDTSTLEPPPALPAGLSYFPQLGGITGGNQNTKSWVRISSNGKAPNFGGDFCTGEPGAAFGLRVEEVFIGDPDFVSVKNHADCAVPVAPFQLRLTTDGVTSPLDVAFTGHSPIASGVTLFVSEPTNKPGDVNAGPIPNAGGVAGTVQLCLVGCGSPGTTVDAIAWDGVLAAGGTPTPFPALPAPITFTPGGLEGITDASQGTLSYQRAALIGQSSRFLASDWKTAAKSR